MPDKRRADISSCVVVVIRPPRPEDEFVCCQATDDKPPNHYENRRTFPRVAAIESATHAATDPVDPCESNKAGPAGHRLASPSVHFLSSLGWGFGCSIPPPALALRRSFSATPVRAYSYGSVSPRTPARKEPQIPAPGTIA